MGEWVNYSQEPGAWSPAAPLQPRRPCLVNPAHPESQNPPWAACPPRPLGTSHSGSARLPLLSACLLLVADHSFPSSCHGRRPHQKYIKMLCLRRSEVCPVQKHRSQGRASFSHSACQLCFGCSNGGESPALWPQASRECFTIQSSLTTRSRFFPRRAKSHFAQR